MQIKMMSLLILAIGVSSEAMLRYPVAQNPGLWSRLRAGISSYLYGPSSQGNRTQVSVSRSQPWYGPQLAMPEEAYEPSQQPMSRPLSGYDQQLVTQAKGLAAQGKADQLQEFLTKRPELRREVLGSLRSNASNNMMSEMLRKPLIESSVVTDKYSTRAELRAQENQTKLLDSLDAVLYELFEHFAKKDNVKITMNIDNIAQTFPKKTWWEQVAGDKEEYSWRVFRWLFDPTRTRLEIVSRELSDDEKRVLNAMWEVYAEKAEKNYPDNSNAVLRDLKILVRHWRHTDLNIMGANSILGLKYFLPKIENAIEADNSLKKYLDDAGVELSDLKDQYIVKEAVREVIAYLFKLYKDDISKSVDEFVAKEKQNIERKREYVEGLSQTAE